MSKSQVASGDDAANLPPLKPGGKLGEMTIVANHFPSPHAFDFCEEEELASGTCQLPSDVGNLDIILDRRQNWFRILPD